MELAALRMRNFNSLLSLLLSLPLSLLLLARPQAASAAGPLLAASDTMAQRVQPCTVCHGREGRASNAGYFPRIAGKPAGYLYAQLLNFRDGRRQNAAMQGLIDTLSDSYLREIAEHFAALDLPYPSPLPAQASAAALARGETLVQQGDSARGLPACASCHGAAMTGVMSAATVAVPGLLGLPRDYMMAQLGAWRTGLRKASVPDCMAQVATRLSADDLSAVASWLAAQRVPADARPAARVAGPLPLDCGPQPP